MTRESLVVLTARQLVAEHAAASDRKPDGRAMAQHWASLLELLRLDPNEARRYSRAFEEAWIDEVDWLWSKYQTAQTRVGPRLRELHQEAQLSPQDIARGIGVSRQYIYKIYSEKANPTADMVAELLNASGHTWADLDYPHRRRLP